MKKKTKGFVLIAALGVLATIFLMVATVAVTARILYDRSGNDKIRAELSVLLDSGLDKLRQVFWNQQITKPEEMHFNLQSNVINLHIEPLSEASELYSQLGLSYKEGDARTTIFVNYPVGGIVHKAQKTYLVNTKGLRKGVVSLSKIRLGKVSREQ